MKTHRTLKEIALELLEKYGESESTVISEYSCKIGEDLGALKKEIEDYRKEIDNA